MERPVNPWHQIIQQTKTQHKGTQQHKREQRGEDRVIPEQKAFPGGSQGGGRGEKEIQKKEEKFILTLLYTSAIMQQQEECSMLTILMPVQFLIYVLNK